MKTCNYALALALGLAWALALVADPIGTSTATQGCTFTYFSSTKPGCVILTSNSQTGFSSPSQTSFNGTYSVTGASENLDETAYAGAGMLKGYVSESSASGAYPITEVTAGPVSSMEDILTFSDPSLNGTAGDLVLGLSVDATSNSSPVYVDGVASFGGVFAYTGAPVSEQDASAYSFIRNYTGAINTQFSGTAIPFIWGQPVAFEISIVPAVGVSCENIVSCSSYSLAGPVYTNALDTAILDDLSVYDSSGNPIPSANWSVTAESGLDYASNGVVPEPSSYTLSTLCLGVLALFGWRRRREMRNV